MMQLDEMRTTRRLATVDNHRKQASPVCKLARLREVFPFSILLFGLWVVLSEKFDVFHLGIGAASSLAIALGTYRLLLLPPAIGPTGVYPMAAVPWLRLLAYIPWLIWQIVIASVQVAVVVVHPKMPISPCLIRFRTPLPHALARLTLATSITLTPGTITVDVQNDEFLVHALTQQGADALMPPEGDGTMQQRVASLYARVKTVTQEL
jgi:multicomponent Na+:H+ antiporter subunit E